ncbi:hypothetical protein OIDMADRAFT_18314 [Oidiodendron maius Zn]|uniref:MARVEL domain-containing protein n=1 Tax=Oidiodendron maius (strain Zn) TaxID=913774 RepID=A0A0C3HH37_OIDMZ|nr:hypothetical protein OIDMADRAFT_18314 [Oidiodendron maius Zn]
MAANKLNTLVLLVNRVLQWSSAVIVMGITSYFIHRHLRGEHSKYTEVISTMSVVFFLPGFASIWVSGRLSLLVIAIDTVFSYLWLTSFIFAAQDYNWHHDCRSFPQGATCSKKYAQEAFIFLAFFFTLTGIGLELWSYWQRNRDNATPLHEKRHDPESAGGPPLDAPAA